MASIVNNGNASSATSTNNQPPYMFLNHNKFNNLFAQTPAIQLNTPTMFALTPIEAITHALSPILSSIPQLPQPHQQ